MTRGRAAVTLMTVAAMLLVPAAAHAQFGGIGGKIKAKAKARVEQKENEAADKVVDAADPSKQGQGAATVGEAEAPDIDRSGVAVFAHEREARHLPAAVRPALLDLHDTASELALRYLREHRFEPSERERHPTAHQRSAA
jgi:hypothetical protein